MEKPMVIFDQYHKISDHVYWIGNNISLKMNVILHYTSEANPRNSFHKEVEYFDTSGNSNVIIRRIFDYYLSIESVKQNDFGVKEFIKIGPQDILLVRMGLAKAYDWFVSQEYNDLYATENGELIIKRKVLPVHISGLCMDRFIILEPTVLYFNGQFSTGVRMTTPNLDTSIDISLQNFMGLIYTLDSFNLFLSAQTMLAYLGRPESGTNLFTIDSTKPEPSGVQGPDRKVQPVKPPNSKSFFSKFE